MQALLEVRIDQEMPSAVTPAMQLPTRHFLGGGGLAGGGGAGDGGGAGEGGQGGNGGGGETAAPNTYVSSDQRGTLLVPAS